MSSQANVTGSGLQDVNRANVLDVGSVYKSNVNLSLVDPGALQAGGELASAGIMAANEAVEAMAGTTTEAFAFAGQGVNQFVTQVAADSEANRQFAGSGAAMVTNSIMSAGKAVLNFVTGEAEKNRAFAGQAAKTAIDAADAAKASAAAMAEFAKVESENNRAFAGQAVAEVARANKDALAAIESGYSNYVDAFQDAQDKAFSFAGGAVTAANTHIASMVSAVTANSLKAVESIGEAQRSDAAKSVDKIIVLVGVIAVALMWKRGG